MNQNQEWGIEINHARKLYLNTDFRIDVIDNLIKKCCMYCQSWEYWHAPILHEEDFVTVIAFGMYLEVV